jgi:uncharacterized membrane protein YozB (DUF420 family)
MENAIVGRPEAQARGSAWPWIALLILTIAVVGFSRSYYLKGVFHSRALPVTVHMHGLLMSLWLVIFATQVGLVESGRIRWHQRLGLAATVIAVLVVTSGVYLTLAGLETEVQAHRVAQFHFLLGLNLVNLSLFVVFIGCGLFYRRRPDVHKRCMLLATIALLAPATARIALLFSHGVTWQFVCFYSVLAACVAVDTIHHRRLHPALGWGSALIVIAFQGIYFIEKSPGWLPLVARIFGG